MILQVQLCRSFENAFVFIRAVKVPSGCPSALSKEVANPNWGPYQCNFTGAPTVPKRSTSYLAKGTVRIGTGGRVPVAPRAFHEEGKIMLMVRHTHPTAAWGVSPTERAIKKATYCISTLFNKCVNFCSQKTVVSLLISINSENKFII